MAGRTVSVAAIALAVAAALAVAMVSDGSHVEAAAGPTSPPDPADFDDPLPNPYFPLEPGFAATCAAVRTVSA